MKTRKISLPLIFVSVVAFFLLATGIASWIITITQDFKPEYSAAGEVLSGIDLTSPTYNGEIHLPTIIDEEKISTSTFSIGYVKGSLDNYKESDFTTISFDSSGKPIMGPKNAGTYTLLYKNKNDGSMVQVKFTINKAELLDTDIVLPTLSPIFYGNTPTFSTTGSVTHELATKNLNGENNVETVGGTFVVISTPNYVGTESTSLSPITIKFDVPEDGNYYDKELTTNVTMYPVACIGSNFYGTVVDAINAANAAGSGEIFVLINNKGISGDIIGKTINEQITIKSGVTLTIPYGMDDTTSPYTFNITLDQTKTDTSNLQEFGELYHASKTNFADSVANHNFLKNYIVIGDGASIVISSGATVKVTGIIGSTGQGLQGHTSGAYAEIKMMKNSSITVNGILICGGYIKEVNENLEYINYLSTNTLPYTSKVTLKSGGEARLPYVVHDYRGGTSTAGMYVNGSALSATSAKGNIAPYNRYNMPNIQSRLIIEYGGLLKGYADLYTGAMSLAGIINVDAQHNLTPIKVIGNTNEYLVQMYTGTKIISDCVVSTPGITTTTPNTCKTTLYMSGTQGASLNYMSLTVQVGISITIDTKNVYLPVCDLYDIVFENGEYDISTKVKVLPGCNVTIKKGAKVDINSDTIVYSDFVDTATIYPYPSSTQLGQTGANLMVNGTLNINSGVSFGGIIKAIDGNGVLNINSGATLMASSKEGIGYRDGLNFLFKENSTSPIKERTKAYIYENGEISDDLTTLAAGTYYSIKGNDNEYGWYSENCVIYFDANGGTLTGSSSEGPYSTGETGYPISSVNTTIPTRNHYTFTGWYSTPECEVNDLVLAYNHETNSYVIPDETYVTFTNIVIYAGWIPNEYTIHYNYDFEKFNLAEVTIDNPNDSTFNVEDYLMLEAAVDATNEISKKYVFGGWFLDSDHTTPCAAIDGSIYADQGFINLYGLWYPNGTTAYTINYEMINNDNITQSSATVISTAIDKYILPSYPTQNNDSSYSKYFIGWYVDENGDGEYDTEFNTSDHLNNDFVQNDEKTLTLYGVWQDKANLKVVGYHSSNNNLFTVTEYVIPGTISLSKYSKDLTASKFAFYKFTTGTNNTVSGITTIDVESGGNYTVYAHYLKIIEVTISLSISLGKKSWGLGSYNYSLDGNIIITFTAPISSYNQTINTGSAGEWSFSLIEGTTYSSNSVTKTATRPIIGSTDTQNVNISPSSGTITSSQEISIKAT